MIGFPFELKVYRPGKIFLTFDIHTSDFLAVVGIIFYLLDPLHV